MDEKKKRRGIENLKVIRTSERAAELARKGAETRREQRTVRDILKAYLRGGLSDAEREKAEALGLIGIGNRALLIAAGIIKKALAGDLRAAEMVLKLTGEDKKEAAIISKIMAETQLLTAQADALRRQQEEAAELGAVTVNVNITNTAGEDD